MIIGERETVLPWRFTVDPMRFVLPLSSSWMATTSMRHRTREVSGG